MKFTVEGPEDDPFWSTAAVSLAGRFLVGQAQPLPVRRGPRLGARQRHYGLRSALGTGKLPVLRRLRPGANTISLAGTVLAFYLSKSAVASSQGESTCPS